MQTSFRAALPLAGALLATLGAAPAHATSTALHGVRLVTSGPIISPLGVQHRGFVSCPRGFVPLGGGAFVNGQAASLNGSFPTSTGWIVDVNNPAATNTVFEVRVICARRPRLYSLVTSGFVPDPPGGGATVTVTCPAGSLPLGGGSDTTSLSTAMRLTGSSPDASGWRVDEDNTSGPDANAMVAGITTCGKVKGYSTQANGPLSIPAHTTLRLAAGCPIGSVAIGGGVLGEPSPAIAISSSGPDGMFWDNAVLNTSAAPATATAWAVCARA
jgi:hypothetical protein